MSLRAFLKSDPLLLMTQQTSTFSVFNESIFSSSIAYTASPVFLSPATDIALWKYQRGLELRWVLQLPISIILFIWYFEKLKHCSESDLKDQNEVWTTYLLLPLRRRKFTRGSLLVAFQPSDVRVKQPFCENVCVSTIDFTRWYSASNKGPAILGEMCQLILSFVVENIN